MTSKIAMINDTHWGVRNDDQNFSEYFKRFYEGVFFPTLRRQGISRIFHLGDIVDRRKYINFASAKRLREDFIEMCVANGIELHIILGNHDVFYKNTNDLNAMEELNVDKYPNVFVYKDATEVMIDNLKVLLMPWICSGNYEHAMKAIETTDAQVLFGHLELSGFAMYKGNVNDHGMSPKVFEKFDQVMTGHYHHKSSSGNINYLGAPYQMTWSDYGDVRGFHIYDTSNRILEHIVNPFEMFHKVTYNDEGKSMEDVLIDCEPYRDNYVKLVVEKKTNPYWFDMLINKFEAAGVKDLKILDDGDKIDLDDDDFVDEAQDTLTILNGFIDQMDVKGNRQDLTELLRDLYRDAASSE